MTEYACGSTRLERLNFHKILRPEKTSEAEPSALKSTTTTCKLSGLVHQVHVPDILVGLSFRIFQADDIHIDILLTQPVAAFGGSVPARFQIGR